MKNIIVSILISTAVASSAYAQQSVRFTNVNPEVVVPLLTNTMSFSSTGNILASCKINTATNTCQGIVTTGGGSSGIKPTVSLVSVPSATAPFTTATSFTITPTVSNAAVCLREQLSGTSVSAWSGATSNVTSAITLNFPTTGTFELRETCYNSAGSTSSNVVTVLIETDTLPNGNCPQSFVPTLNSLGFTRDTTRQTVESAFQGFSFPSTGSIRPVGVGVNKYLALEFNTGSAPIYPGGSGSLRWLEAQGTIGQLPFADGYITISKCMGDFRTPTNDPKDPTTYAGCRNLRPSGANEFASFLSINLRENVAPSASVCVMQPNTKYFLNFVAASPTNGGFLVNENNCSSQLSGLCGFQMNFQ